MARRKDFHVAGCLALVTGAGSGIGRAVSLELADQGARVVALDIDGEAAEKAAAACSERGAEAYGLACDVADAAAVAKVAEQVHESWGVLDVLVNNAGVSMLARWADTTVDDWNWIRSVNLDGVVHCCYAFGPAMLEERRGHIVNVSSVVGYWPHGILGAYVTTKAAVLALSRSLRADWGKHGVGVSAVCPGGVNTSLLDRTRFPGQRGAERRDLVIAARSRSRPAEVVGREVIRAIREDKVVLPVGWEAKVGWWAHRVIPLRLQSFLAGLGID